MKRIAVFADIHGRIDRLEDFFGHATNLGVQEYYFLGDVTNKWPCYDESRCLELLIKHNVIGVRGNHDAKTILLMKNYPLLTGKYTTAAREFLEELPAGRQEGNVRLTHAGPDDILLELTPQTILLALQKVSNDAGINACFFGHTHIPGVYFTHHNKTHEIPVQYGQEVFLPKKCLFNPGSIGTREPPTFAVYNPENQTATFHALRTSAPDRKSIAAHTQSHVVTA